MKGFRFYLEYPGDGNNYGFWRDEEDCDEDLEEELGEPIDYRL